MFASLELYKIVNPKPLSRHIAVRLSGVPERPCGVTVKVAPMRGRRLSKRNMTMKAIILGLTAAVLAAGGAYAADTKPVTATTKPAMTATAKPATAKPMMAHSEISKKCSADADAQKLHGKARKAFRKTCMKAKAA